jgi:hypothetical protein
MPTGCRASRAIAAGLCLLPEMLPAAITASIAGGICVTVHYLRFSSDPYLRIDFLEDVAGLRLTGEADLCGVESLRAALAALPPEATIIHLELAGLRFIDVGSTRELVELARKAPRPRFVLHSPPPMLTRMIDLLWPPGAIRYTIENKRASCPGDCLGASDQLLGRLGPAKTSRRRGDGEQGDLPGLGCTAETPRDHLRVVALNDEIIFSAGGDPRVPE